ncbi:MAG TPA: CDP-alcohol phosphatidyltransferase family protein [Alphaproteobacteria bacterium]|nr:CDP-alcohol phosphatidyltransferase family protein [Alphaproteobacteria bacterium]
MQDATSDPVRNRRPIAARELRIFQMAAEWLSRRKVTANAISVAGMTAGMLAGLAFALTPYAGSVEALAWFAAAALIQLRLLANMLDGMVALASGTASRLGELFNEVPDRVSDSATLIGLGYAVGGDELLGFAAATAAMATAYVRALGVAAGARAEFCGPMAKQQRMFVATAVAVLCGVASLVQIAVDVGGCGLPAIALAIITAGAAATALRRLTRIARALRSGA